MERVECQFNNYDSDLPLDAGRIENLTNVLVDNEIISPTANITVSGECVWLFVSHTHTI